MSGEVGTLTVNLGLNSAGFSGGIQDVGKQARKAGQDIKESMESSNYSMMEARHGAMMLGEAFGVHIPRGISTMIASFGPVGSVLAAAFPFAAIALGAALIAKHFEKVREEAEKTANGMAKIGEEIGTHTDELALSTAKLKEQFAILEHNPKNSVAIALAEARVEADHLASSLATDFEKIGDLYKESSRGSLLQFLMGENSSNQVRDITSSLSAAMAKVPKDSNFGPATQQVLKDAWIKAQIDINANQDKGSSDNNEGLKNLQTKLSAYYDQLTMVGENDAWKKQVDDIKDYQSNVEKIAEAENARWAFRNSQEAAANEAENARTTFRNEQEEKANEAENARWEFGKLLVKQQEEEIQNSRKLADSENEITQAQIKARASGQLTAVKVGQSLGITSKKQELATILQIDKEELADYQKTSDKHLAILKADADKAAELAKGSTDPSVIAKSTQAQEAYNKALAQQITELQALKNKVAEATAEVKKYGESWQTAMALMTANQKSFASSLQSDSMKAIDGFSEGIAKAIVEGKSLGAAMKNVAKQILEDMISTISQILIKWAIMSAATGGMGGAATSGIGGLGKMLGFSGGGIVPSAADGMITPGNWDQGHLAMLHSQEMVLPAPLSQKVQNMTEGGGKTIHQHHVTYSPTVTAVDGKGVGDLLNKHGELFTAHMMKQMRRMNK